MTNTIAQGAANQAGARVNADAYAEAQDFLPLKGIDYVEFWVGNARQASAYYRALWGFTPVAFSGLETKVRDRASYVMKQNDITFVFTAPLTPDGEIAEHVHRHGDGVHDIAFAVDDVRSAWRETTSRGAASALEPTELDGGDDGVLRKASIRTYGETLHSFVDRRQYGGVFAPGYRKVKKPARAAGGSACSRSTTASATWRSARWTSSSTSTRTCSASASSSTTTTRSSTPNTAP
jgi:4-hydroxyphenylpyruvate dioxygenase-like putative hemolysin